MVTCAGRNSNIFHRYTLSFQTLGFLGMHIPGFVAAVATLGMFRRRPGLGLYLVRKPPQKPPYRVSHCLSAWVGFHGALWSRHSILRSAS